MGSLIYNHIPRIRYWRIKMKIKQLLNFQQTKRKKLGSSLLILASRWITILPNFSPLGSYGFFGRNLIGFYGGIIVFDWLRSGFYPGFAFTHLGFLSYYLFGRLFQKLKNKKGFKFSLLLLPAASLSFFLISNFGVWLFWYPRNLQGLFSCYLAALPFYRNTLLGDLFFGGLFVFGKQVYMNYQFQKTKIQKNTSYNLDKCR